MYRSVSKITVFSFVLLINAVSLSMELEKSLNYHMLDAALSRDVNKMLGILNSTDQRNFDINFTEHYSLRLSDMPGIKRYKELDIVSILQKEGVPACYIDGDNRVNVNDGCNQEQRECFKNKIQKANELALRYENNWKKATPASFRELDLRSNLHKQGVNCDPLFKACFYGEADKVKLELGLIVDENMIKYNNNSRQCLDNNLYKKWVHIHCCFFMATYNNDESCIKALLSQKTSKESVFGIGVDLLLFAMKHNAKAVFKLLVKNNAYGCLSNDTFWESSSDEHKITILDKICSQKDIPYIADYVRIYREFGGRCWYELENI